MYQVGRRLPPCFQHMEQSSRHCRTGVECHAADMVSRSVMVCLSRGFSHASLTEGKGLCTKDCQSFCQTPPITPRKTACIIIITKSLHHDYCVFIMWLLSLYIIFTESLYNHFYIVIWFCCENRMIWRCMADGHAGLASWGAATARRQTWRLDITMVGSRKKEMYFSCVWNRKRLPL